MAEIFKFPDRIEQEQVRRKIMNASVHLGDNLILVSTDDGLGLTAFMRKGVEFIPEPTRVPVGFEQALMLQAAILEAKILLLLERHEPDSINWDLPPSTSVTFEPES